MATATLTPDRAPSRNRKKIAFRIFSGGLLLVIIAVVGAIGWFYNAATSSLPQLDGTIQSAGLTAPVTVMRDAQGVPHISASTLEDALFAQGLVTAQDRLWQMDTSRRFGRGQLSEILGARMLALDKRQRALDLTTTAQRAIARLSPEERSQLDAYVKGVNALMERQMSKLPIEFRILGYKPTPWTAVDSMMVGINISASLNMQYPLELEREGLIKNLPAEIVTDLYPNNSWRDRPPSALPRQEQHLPDAPPEGAPGPDDDGHGLLNWPAFSSSNHCEACTPGSNNWVVSGAHTTTGKPLVSNDMHLGHSIPNVWYEVHVKAPGYNVAGVSFPGLPFVIAGHNERIAWGFTNVGPDVQDLYAETFNAAGEYETPTGWQKPEVRHEVIKVKGAADVPVDVVITRHGPIVTPAGDTRKVALKWTIYDPQVLSFRFHAIGQAQNWEQFRAALATFGGAPQNVVYGDVDGNIGYQTAGFIPVRAKGDGLLPVPGNRNDFEWTGYIPFDKLPSVYNPAAGVLATANGRVTPDGYPYLIANQWGPPFRTERIYKVLEAGKKFSAADMLTLQMDTYSELDRIAAQRFVYAIDRQKSPPERLRKAADLLRTWDGKMEIPSAAATIAVKSRRALWKLLLEPKLGAQWDKYAWFGSTVALEKILRTRPARWLPQSYANFDALMSAAVQSAIDDKEAPKDVSTWKYGNAYPVQIEHPIFGTIPILRGLAGPGTHSQSGSSLTVKAAGRAFGASQRATYDLSNLDASNLNIVVGQSGQMFSPYYQDQFSAWYSGKSFTLPFSEGAVASAAQHKLTLQP
ncbi:MAG TPA: penicillin acylase family protein [Terriglobales bacterium]|nr:penicillin acylase family protein [Terriglobales bacterium]